MKKNFISYACVAAALVFASCQKEVQINNGTDALPSDLDEVTATILNTTKTVTEDGINVLWENGDKIGLRPFTGAETNTNQMVEYVTTLENNSPTATFVKAADCELSTAARNGKYIAFYPINPKYYIWSGKNEYITVGIRDYDKEKYEQILPLGGGWDDKSSLMIATSEDGTNFQFKHVMSYIKFTVDADSPEFDRVVITTNSGQELTNRINVYYDGTYKLNDKDSYRSSSVTLLTSEGAAFTPGTYYAALLPQTYTGGFKIAFYNANTLLGVKKIKDDVAFERGDVGNLGTIGQFTAADLPQLELATVYTDDNGVNQGVVFWVNPDMPSEGKIISGATTFVKWGPAKDLSDAMDEYLTGDHTIAEKAEFVKAASDYSEANYSAVYFCDNLGEGWRLPHRDELVEMLKVYWGQTSLTENTKYNIDDNSSSMDKFDEALAQCVTDDPATSYNETKLNYGTPTSNVNYWTGHANPASLPSTRIFRVNMAPTYVYASYANPTNVQYVRCIRDVSLL